jgi:hypothetical protein
VAARSPSNSAEKKAPPERGFSGGHMHGLDHSPCFHNAESGSRFEGAPLRFVQGRLQSRHVSLWKPDWLCFIITSHTIERLRRLSRPEGATAEKAVPSSKTQPFDRDHSNRKSVRFESFMFLCFQHRICFYVSSIEYVSMFPASNMFPSFQHRRNRSRRERTSRSLLNRPLQVRRGENYKWLVSRDIGQ